MPLSPVTRARICLFALPWGSRPRLYAFVRYRGLDWITMSGVAHRLRSLETISSRCELCGKLVFPDLSLLIRTGVHMKRKASAVWNGGLKDGKGTISTDSGVLANTQYSFSTRFEDGVGTNPEELIAA